MIKPLGFAYRALAIYQKQKEQDEGLEVSELLLQGSGIGYQEEKQRNMLGDLAALHTTIIHILRRLQGVGLRFSRFFDDDRKPL